MAPFAASRRLLMGVRPDVSAHMVKVWKAYKYQNGEVVSHLSPMSNQVLMPWVRIWPKRLLEKFTSTVGGWGIALGITVGTVVLSEKEYHAIAHRHRD